MAVSIRFTVTQNSQKREENKTNVTVKLYCKWTYGSYNHKSPNGTVTIDGTKYSFSANINPNNTTSGENVIYTKTLDISHNTDGTKTLTCSASFATGVSSGTVTASINKVLTKIVGFPTLKSGEDFTDEENPTIKYTNPMGNNVTSLRACISFTGATDDISYRDISKTAGSYTFNLTDAERTILRKKTSNIKGKFPLYFYLECEYSGQIKRVKKLHYLSIVNAAPTINPSISCSYSNLTGNEDTVILNKNTITIDCGAKALKEATIKKCEVTCGSKKLTGASGILTNVDSNVFVFTVTDSRGNVSTKTITKPFVDYIRPTCNLSVTPPTPNGELTYTISGKYFNGSFGVEDNIFSLWLRTKVNDEEWGEWIHYSYTKTNNTYTVTTTKTGLDYESTYSFQARVADKLFTLTPLDSTIKTDIKVVKLKPVFDWGENDFNFNCDVSFANNERIMGTTTDGQQINCFQPLNQNNNCVLGYGGWDNNIGATHIYGDDINIFTNTDLSVNGYSILGAIKAMTNSYTLETTPTAGDGWTIEAANAILCGNMLRVHINAVRATATNTGNITNETVVTLKIKHDGKIKGMLNVSFPSGATGGMCAFNTDDSEVDSTYLYFDVSIVATAQAITQTTSYFTIPVTIDTTKY